MGRQFWHDLVLSFYGKVPYSTRCMLHGAREYLLMRAGTSKIDISLAYAMTVTGLYTIKLHMNLQYHPERYDTDFMTLQAEVKTSLSSDCFISHKFCFTCWIRPASTTPTMKHNELGCHQCHLQPLRYNGSLSCGFLLSVPVWLLFLHQILGQGGVQSVEHWHLVLWQIYLHFGGSIHSHCLFWNSTSKKLKCCQCTWIQVYHFNDPRCQPSSVL